MVSPSIQMDVDPMSVGPQQAKKIRLQYWRVGLRLQILHQAPGWIRVCCKAPNALGWAAYPSWEAEDSSSPHIFGHGPSARQMRDGTGIDLLHKRREKLVQNWPRNPSPIRAFLRGGSKREIQSRINERRNPKRNRFVEPVARTDRHRNYPLISMIRRRLNQEWTVEYERTNN